MDENWPLFVATITGRAPTENEARLLEASRRLWPAALTAVKKQVFDQAGLSSDPKSIATARWEEALSSTLRTMSKLKGTKISDLDSYLFAIFLHRLNRYLAQERKRQQIVEFLSGSDDLASLEGAKDTSWMEKIESRIALQQALARTDRCFRAMAWYYSQDFSWKEIGTLFGLRKEQARQRFEYGIRKLRKWLQRPPEEHSGPE
jgi:RNA polymerase sigma factor (sigma-70 family)